MELNYIKFDTAKLAKELGLPQRKGKMYDNGKLKNVSFGMSAPSDYGDRYVSAIKQQELQKWLREKHGLCAYIDWENLECKIIDYKDKDEVIVYVGNMYSDTPEDDLEDILQKALGYMKEYKWINVDEFNLRKHGK